MQSQTRLRTAGEVIKQAGGPTKVARRFQTKPNVVSMWKSRNSFPPDTLLAWQEILKELKATAPAELWKQKEVTKSTAEGRSVGA